MKPSVFASFFIFLTVGVVSTYKLTLKTDDFVRIILIIVMFSSALYYYYLNVATEQTVSLRQRTHSREIFTWWITASQYVVFFSLWYLLRIEWRLYSLGFLFLNLSYLVWDLTHLVNVWDDVMSRTMFLFDITGLILSAIFFVVTISFPPADITTSLQAHHAMAIAITGVLLIVQSFGGLIAVVWQFRYNPFQYLAMDGTPIRRNSN